MGNKCKNWRENLRYLVDVAHTHLLKRILKTTQEADRLVKEVISCGAVHQDIDGTNTQISASLEAILKLRQKSKPTPEREISQWYESMLEAIESTGCSGAQTIADMDKIFCNFLVHGVVHKNVISILDRLDPSRIEIVKSKSRAARQASLKIQEEIDNRGGAHHRPFKSPIVEGAERNPGHRAHRTPRTIHPGI